MAQKTLVLMDFDGTITRTDTMVGLIRHKAGLWGMLRGMAALAPWLLAYRLGLYPNHKAKEKVLTKFFGGMAREDFLTLADAYFKASYPDVVRPQAEQCIREHLRQGHKMVIVTASAEEWVECFAAALGADCLIGTRLEVDAKGCITGRLSTPNCHGQQKVQRVMQQIPDWGEYHITAYGDSKGDSQMLAMADEPHYKPFRE